MKFPPIVKTLVSFLLAAIIACTIFTSPVKASELAIEPAQIQQERVTVVPEIPSEVLQMMCPRRAEAFTEFFHKQQLIFDRLDAIEGISEKQYSDTKQAYIGIERTFAKIVNFFVIEKNSKETFMRLMEEKVFSQIS